MQNRGQYGVPEQPQYVVGRPPPQHIFAISHDNMSALSPSAAVHNRHAEHHPQHQHSHQQQVQYHHQHLHGPHPGHQPHPSLHPQQQQQPQPHQTLSPHAAHAPHVPQHEHAQHPVHQPSPLQQVQQTTQQQQLQQQQAQAQAQAQAQKQAQHQMVQQLGLSGGPDSPEAPSPVGSRPSPTTNSKQLVTVEHDDEDMEDEGRSASGSRWPRQETLALIKLRSDMDANFRDSGLKGPLWEEVSRKLAELGYQRSAKKCKEKFENVHKYYKKTKDGRAGRQDGKSYRFFSELEALYGSQHAAAQMEANAGGARLLLTTGSVPVPTAVQITNHGVNVSAQRPSEVSTCATMSDSSEDDYEEPTAGGEGDKQLNKKKRKRLDDEKTGSSKKEFIDLLVKKLMDRQEAMQHEFLNSMQRREQERQVREEAWRRQEMAILARENELRNQERVRAASREAALVAFLQKVTGQTFELPQPPLPTLPTLQPLVVSVAPIVSPIVMPSLAVQVVPPQPTSTPTMIPNPKPDPPPPTIATFEEPDKGDGSFEPTSSRWPKPEVHALIRLRSEMEPRFQEAGPKGPLWEEVSSGMACLGYNRNSKRCKEKWENINKYFKKTKESNKKRPENAKTCPYFHQLENLYRQGKIGTPHNKVAKAHEQVDHQALPIANRDDAIQVQGVGQSEILKILPPPPEVGQVTAASTGNGAAGHIVSSPEDGGNAEVDTKKAMDVTA